MNEAALVHLREGARDADGELEKGGDLHGLAGEFVERLTMDVFGGGPGYGQCIHGSSVTLMHGAAMPPLQGTDEYVSQSAPHARRRRGRSECSGSPIAGVQKRRYVWNGS
jgi:hypothetical protein